MSERPKKKQKPKAGRVIRIDSFLQRFFESRRGRKDTFSQVIRRELGLTGAALFALEVDLFPTKGELIVAAAKRKLKEKDLRVRKVKEIK